MEDNDLASLLSKRGVSNDKAELIQNRLNGTDLLNLIFDLKDGSSESIQNANQILSKFDIIIKEGKRMAYNNVIRTNVKLDDFLKENNIPYDKKMGNLFFMDVDSKTKSLVENFISENKNMNRNRRIMELAGITPSMEPDTPAPDATPDIDGDDDIFTSIPDEETQDDSSVPVVTDDNDTVPLECSPEMSQIQDAINNIQTLAPEVKVSELKTVVIRVKELYDQIQNLGRSYLD